jgi:putative membrane protein
MNRFVVIGLIAGIGLLIALLAHYGLGDIFRAVATLGWDGFAVVVLYHLGLIALMGLAWWVLGAGRADCRPRAFVFGRLIREAASEALPFSQIGGFVLGARAAALAGVENAFAAASIVVDISLELIAQLGYVLIGLALLARLRPDSRLLEPLVFGVLAMALVVAVFVAVQKRGVALVEVGIGKLAEKWVGATPRRAGGLCAAIHEIHGRTANLAISTFGHLGTWLLNGVEAWITLRLMGVHLSVAEVVVIDSLLYGIRSVAFFVPNAIGVQEGGYVMLGAMFGLSPDAALALSLIRRGRDLLIAWQLLEGKRAWRTSSVIVEPPTADAL